MAETTGIEWADATANFWIGCTKLSPACDHCYAEADWDHRKHRVQWGPHGDRSFVKAGEQVVRKMQRKAAAFIAEHGRKPRIFVNSLSDFADNHWSILPEWRELVWQLARECPDVILMILTKRPQNLPGYLPADWGAGYPNVWIGTTAENQTEADRRVPLLLSTPAAVRFLSCEPLLGTVDLTHVKMIDCELDGGGSMVAWESALNGERFDEWADDDEPPVSYGHAMLNWVIVGGESGPKARPMHPDWARSLRDQCAGAGVPFLFKQWGLSAPLQKFTGEPVGNANTIWPNGRTGAGNPERDGGAAVQMYRGTKSVTGRLLDGVQHDGFPASEAA